MNVAGLVLPVFAIIVTGWLAGRLGYIPRALADGLVHFAYNVAMPALLVVTIAQEQARNLLEWRFLLAFGGGSMLCFALVFVAVRAALRPQPRQQHHLRHDGGDDQHRFRRAAGAALDLRPARRAAGGDRHRVRGGRDVSRHRHPAGGRGARRRRQAGAPADACKADRAEPDGARDPGRPRLVDHRLAHPCADRGLSQHPRRRAHALRAVRHRPRPDAGRLAREAERCDGADGRQTR